MAYMGSEKFKSYLYADEELEELKREQRLEVKRAYADIHPTRMAFSTESGKMYSESINVANYAIYLIDMKEEQQRQLTQVKNRSLAFQEAMNALETEERRMVEEYKRAHIQSDYEKLSSILLKLTRYLEVHHLKS